VRTKKGVESREYSARAMEPAAFQQALNVLRSNVEREVASDRNDIQFMRARIEAWRPKDVRTVNEQDEERRTAEERTKRGRQKQEREAERAARAVDAETKRQATEARRVVERAEFLKQLYALAARPDHESAEVRGQAARLGKKLRGSYAWLWETHIDREPSFVDALLRLGLAEHRDAAEFGGTGTHVHYRF
jgi:hypothetical protein